MMDKQRGGLTRDDQSVLLTKAKEAAAAGDPRTAIDCLFKSFALDGLARLLRRRWRRLTNEDIDTAIAEAVNDLYEYIAGGKVVFNIMAFLTKVAERKAYALNESLTLEEVYPPEEINELIDRDAITSESNDHKLDVMKGEAIRLARSLLPRLGQQNLQDVMSMVIDAAERGIPDLPSKVIAEALGLSDDVVRQSLTRGFRKLERIAREDGLTDGFTFRQKLDMAPEVELR